MILVTGAAGFIGSHLTEQLLKNRNIVLGIDNFDNYYDIDIKRENLKTSLEYKNFLFERCDIRNKKSLTKLFAKHHIEIVYHLAARPGVRPSFVNPYIYDQINVQGTMALLEICNAFGVKKIVFISSSSVYGDNKIPFRESEYPLKPLSFYGTSKLNAEEICKFFSRRFGFCIWIFRLFSIYGPRLRPDLAIYKFTKAILEGKEIQLYNYGQYKRDFTYIDNVIAVFIKAKNKFPQKCETVNLGNCQPVPIKKILELLQEKLNKKAIVKYVKNPFNENPITYANIDKAKKLFKYTARFPIEEGLDTFLNWFLCKN